MPDINYWAATQNVRALVRSHWGGSKRYRTKVLKQVENYFVETSLDNDADPWSLSIGDPEGHLLSIFHRDAEAHVKIFGVGRAVNAQLPLLTGIADELHYSDDGVLTLAGRDMSSLAMDSALAPKKWQQIRAWELVHNQAVELGFQHTQLAKNGPKGDRIVKKVQFTDGGETYWEFWHRLYRKEQLWIWTKPDGTLMADKLIYEDHPRYFFGQPRRRDSAAIRARYVPVERLEIKKSTQARVGSVWVYGQSGKAGIVLKVADPTTAHWIKRPRKILMDSDAFNVKQATKTAWEEIYEGKVGSVEFSITLADPGFKIEQNSVCVLNLSDPGVSGEFFIVGVRHQVGDEGYLVEVRLREKGYALSKRIPSDPTVASTSQAVTAAGNVDEYPGAVQAVASGMPTDWGDYFVKAANKWHGIWDYDFFLAVLIAIAHQETGGKFVNVRALGGPGNANWVEWYPWKPVKGATSRSVDYLDENGRTKAAWEEIFANEPGGKYTDATFAVGPMQLYSSSYKYEADHMLTPGREDQYGGGRWHPEFNIMVGAEVVISKNKEVGTNTGREIDMWNGVSRYGHNAQNWSMGKPTLYAEQVKHLVYKDPGYLDKVKDARTAAAKAAATTRAKGFEGQFPTEGTDPPNTGYNNSPQTIALWKRLKPASSHVDLTHVNPDLLRRLNALGRHLSRDITITSGYRYPGHSGDPAGAAPNGGDTQWYLWELFLACGRCTEHKAADPRKVSNHTRGEAVDAEMGGSALWNTVSAAVGAIYGIHNSTSDDPVHTTLIGISG